MKILIVRTFPDILDPMRYNIQEIGLAKALTRAGHKVGIVLYNGKNKDTIVQIPVECNGEEKSIKLYYLHGYNFLKNGLFPSLGKVTKEYDIIQVHEYDQITSWMYYTWSKKPVVIYHGPYYDSFNKGYNLKCKVFDHTFLKIGRKNDVPCFTKSRASAFFLEGKGFTDVLPVGVGVDFENLSDVSIAKKHLRNEKNIYQLLYIGKLEERRNCFFLLDVFRGLIQKGKNFELTVIGNGEASYKESFLREAEDLLQNGKLHYIEKVSQKDIGKYYLNADLMLFPSRYEIFGMVLLEALYYNLPVASSNNGGADMLIRDMENGLIISSFDCTEWVERILVLFNDVEEYDRIISNLQNADKRKLTWDGIADNMIDKYLEIYEELNGKHAERGVV